MKAPKTYIMMAALALSCCMPCTVSAQAKTSFSVMSLNVDGMPAKIYFFDANPDGPHSAGSERVSEYMAAKGCDILCLQEDFNYRWEIWSRLFAGYEHDEWSGGIILDEKEIDFLHPQNLKFECDGLNTLWKNDIQHTGYERVAWHQSFGKFSHAFDDMITKGFRRHDVTLPGGEEVVIYNMHMDASNNRDEMKHNDGKDKAARLAQWQQLRDYIMAHLDGRPVIVAGDMNSLYHRDPVKTQFIDAINASGKATCGDVWIEQTKGGIYPQTGGEPLADETLDKILYINPTGGNQITPMSFKLDREGYQYEGRAMGDHYPIIATFEFTRKQIAGIQLAKPQSVGCTAYDLNGLPLTTDRPAHGIQIIDGKKVVKR